MLGITEHGDGATAQIGPGQRCLQRQVVGTVQRVGPGVGIERVRPHPQRRQRRSQPRIVAGDQRPQSGGAVLQHRNLLVAALGE